MSQKITIRPEKKNIFAIVVTFHPDNELFDRIKTIRNQVDKLLIVDNNSSPECINMISDISKKLDVEIIKNQSNLGIARALNQGIEMAKSFDKKYSWILSLDQDSYCFPSLIENLINAYDDCAFKSDVGIIGTNYKEKTTGRLLHKANSNNKWEEVQNLPTSGCITSLSILSKIGNFRNDLFIDYVDTEFCMRLRRKGYRALISNEIGMIHPLGYYRKSRLNKLLTGSYLITNYPPIRHYYWTRNGLILIYENFWRETLWSLNEIYYIFLRRLIIVILFEDKKAHKLANIFLGIWHALTSQRGIKK